MTTNHYPPIDEKAVLLVRKMANSIPNYFENPLCPYGQKFKELIKNQPAEIPPQEIVAAPVEVDPNKPKATPLFDILENDNINFVEATPTEMYDEVQKLWNQLQTMARSFTGETEDTQVQNYLKLSFAMLEKVTKMKQTIWDARNITQFQEAILTAIEDLVDPDTRNHIIERVKGADR